MPENHVHAPSCPVAHGRGEVGVGVGGLVGVAEQLGHHRQFLAVRQQQGDAATAQIVEPPVEQPGCVWAPLEGGVPNTALCRGRGLG